MKKNSGHKAAQRQIKAKTCEMCGGTKTPQRHHKDGDATNNAKDNLIVLCQKCHTTVHMLNDTWGRGKVKQATCKICGTIFQPKRTRRAKLCGKAECTKENGRRSAALRWA